MCHHVNMEIDWEEAVRNHDSEAAPEDEIDEPAVDGETEPELTLPADD